MLLENITVATLSSQVKTFSFEVVVENTFPHFSLPFGFYCHYCIPQWHTAAGWLPPRLGALSIYMFSYFFFWASVTLLCCCAESCIGETVHALWNGVGVVTKLRQHGFTKAFLNSGVLSTPYSQETPLPYLALMQYRTGAEQILCLDSSPSSRNNLHKIDPDSLQSSTGCLAPVSTNAAPSQALAWRQEFWECTWALGANFTFP